METFRLSTKIEHIGLLIAAATAYFVLADIAGLWAGGLSPNPLWLATASTTAIASLVRPELRVSVIVGGAIGSLLSGLIGFDESLRSLLTPWLGNLAETIVATLALPFALTTQLSFTRTRRAVAWVGVSIAAAALGGLIATIDTASPVIEERLGSLVRWTVGDVVGLLILPPLAMAFRSPWVTPRYSRWFYEAAFSAVCVAAVLVLTFQTRQPVTYLLVPIVMWIGIRFGPRLAAPTAVAVALAATYLTSIGHGPFAAVEDAVVQVQALNIAVALSGMVASAHAVRAWNDQQRLRATLEALPDVIVTIDHVGRPRGVWGPDDLREIVTQFVSTDSPPLDDPLDYVASIDGPGYLLTHDSGAIVEQRTALVSEELSLLLFRDVSAEHEVKRVRSELDTQLEHERRDTRRALARDLHDGPIQMITAARMLLGMMRKGEAFNVDLLDRVDASLNESAVGLRQILDDLSAMGHRREALGSLVDFGSEVLATVDAELVVGPASQPLELPAEVGDAIMLIGREAILNVATHAGATTVELDLTASDHSVVLRVHDNGQGLTSPSTDRAHYGLASMRSRAEDLGGSVEISAGELSGTVVTATLPLGERGLS